ncbi:hypothetical protein DB30_07373 [Enhygromyxa salina]|uniref:Uncharacterized protein n=1 Tax=Enhygromyxa salina TaxID=215803 RepID=A0A0C2D1C5_9BACT|nr:hypothetical protein DB30_07373 [Enhygromyxa salina]
MAVDSIVGIVADHRRQSTTVGPKPLARADRPGVRCRGQSTDATKFLPALGMIERALDQPQQHRAH